MEERKVRLGRRISLEGAQPIGSGYASRVYALPDGNVVKVLRQGGPEEAEREIRLSKWAFSKGLPTAISYDVVDADGRPGLVYESLGRGNLRNAFRDEPERFPELLADYLELLHTVNSISDEEGLLPAAIRKYREALAAVEDLLTPEEAARMGTLLDTVPDKATIIHGDCQIKNVRVVKGELFLIDLDTLSRGDPIFELAGLIFCYRCFPELHPQPYDAFFEIPTETLAQILEGILEGYYPGLSREDRLANGRKAELLAWLKLLALLREDENTPGETTALTRFREALTGVENLILCTGAEEK